jgi:hypothetical protein
MPPRALADRLGWRSPGRVEPPVLTPKFSTHTMHRWAMMLKRSLDIALGGDAVDLFCMVGGTVLWTDVRIITREAHHPQAPFSDG